MNRIYPVLVLLVFLLCGFSPQPKLKKVIFLGDSITQAGNEPGGFIHMIRSILDKKETSVKYELTGAGVGGNKVRDLLARFERDVISQSPDIVFIMIGINDIGFFSWHPEIGGTPKDQYELALTYMSKRVVEKGGSVILCSPTVIGELPHGKNSMDKQLSEYGKIVKKVARKTNSQYINMHNIFMNYLEKYNVENKAKGILTNDSVHMTEEGNRLIAETMAAYLD